MEVDFTPEQEAQLSRIATHDGKNAAQLVKDVALRLLDDVMFRTAVRRGVDQANQGELIEHDEVVARFERKYGA